METPTLEELQEILARSKKFASWRPAAKSKATFGRGQDFSYTGKRYTNLAAVDEKHYTPSDLAEAWGVDVETIRNIFRDEPDVMKICTSRVKARFTLRIPKAVAERVHKRLCS